MGSGAFHQFGDAPGDIDVVLGYRMNSSWEIRYSSGGSPIPLELEGMSAAPTAYYDATALYLYGTGF